MLLIELQLLGLEHALFRFNERPGNSVKKTNNFPARAVPAKAKLQQLRAIPGALSAVFRQIESI